MATYHLLAFTIFLRIAAAMSSSLPPRLVAEMEKHSELMALIYAPGNGLSDETKILQILATKRLILSRLNIKEVPSSICDLEQLEVIDLQSNSISSLPKNFGRLKNLKVLNLSENTFTSIPECVFEFTNLTSLSIANNQIADLEMRGKTSMLDVLTSKKPGPACTSKRFLHLKSLEEFDVSGNHVRQVPAEVFNLPSIQKIKLAKNMIFRLPGKLDVSRSLEHIDLGSNQLSSLELSLPSGCRLRDLDLSDNFFRRIPDSLLGCGSLDRLNLEKNEILTLDESVKNLKLICLDLGGNRLRSFPENIEFPDSLQHLDLRDNNLERLPDSIFKISLEYLDVSLNRLSSIPDGLSMMKSLKYLDISDNCDDHGTFLALPDAVFELEGLVGLKMSHVSLSSRGHDMFENLRNLTMLDLSFTQLAHIPNSVFKLKDLVTLSIKGNSIDSIDDKISDLLALENLDLSRCMLANINEGVCRLPKLRHLNISSNPLKSLPSGLDASLSLVGLDVSSSLKTVAAFKNIDLPLESPKIFPASLEVLYIQDSPALLLTSEVLGRCANIKKLDVSHCGLRSAAFLDKILPNLECLDLSGNQLADFEALSGLGKLVHLSLCSNGMGSIPREVTKLSGLRTLDLSNNSIKLLQDDMKDMASLRVLNLGENMIESIDYEMGSMKSLEILILRSRLVDNCKIHKSVAQLRGLRIVDSTSISCFDSVTDMEERENLRARYLKNMNSRKCLKYRYGGAADHTRQESGTNDLHLVSNYGSARDVSLSLPEK